MRLPGAFPAYLNELTRLGCRLREIAEPALEPAIAAADPGAEAYAHLPNFLVAAARRAHPRHP